MDGVGGDGVWGVWLFEGGGARDWRVVDWGLSEGRLVAWRWGSQSNCIFVLNAVCSYVFPPFVVFLCDWDYLLSLSPKSTIGCLLSVWLILGR